MWPIASVYKGLHTFPKGISLKVNAIAWLEFELAFFKAAVHYFSHYVLETPHRFYNFLVISKSLFIIFHSFIYLFFYSMLS